MTFEEWFEQSGVPNFGDVQSYCRAAWSASKKAEREACAKTCEGMQLYDEDDTGQSCADAIRARNT